MILSYVECVYGKVMAESKIDLNTKCQQRHKHQLDDWLSKRYNPNLAQLLTLSLGLPCARIRLSGRGGKCQTLTRMHRRGESEKPGQRRISICHSFPQKHFAWELELETESTSVKTRVRTSLVIRRSISASGYAASLKGSNVLASGKFELIWQLLQKLLPGKCPVLRYAQ